MSPVASTVVQIFSTLTLLGQIIAVILIVLLIARKVAPKNKNFKKWSDLVSENYVTAIFIVSAVATLGSLSLSEIAAFIPCKLCWFQRIAMYPMSVISLIALIKNDNTVRKYILPISIIGLLISIYHILVQLFPQALECSDDVAKCSAVQFTQFGYITIPVMSFSAFLLIVLISLFATKTSKK